MMLPFSQIRNGCLFSTLKLLKINILHASTSSYNQGQYVDGKTREYFYFIDHQGMLFLDDARIKNFTSCFKEVKFLKFFFSQMKMNNTGRHEDFPFLSLCGKEHNFIRCDDLPFVFSTMLTVNDQKELSYAHAHNKLTVPFEPSELYMEPSTGRVYHPACNRVGGVGLVSSSLAIWFSSFFHFNSDDDRPTHIEWGKELVELNQEIESKLNALENVRKYSLGLIDKT